MATELYDGVKYLWVLSMVLASCHPSGALNFEVVSRFFEKFVPPLFTERGVSLLRVEYTGTESNDRIIMNCKGRERR